MTNPAVTEPDPHTTAGKLADLEHRRYEAVHAGSQQAVAKQHERGKRTARERIDMLLDPGSFTETDELARHRAADFGIAGTRPYGDGVVTGYGTVDGRPVCVFSQDFTVFGGSLGEVYGEKIVKIMDHALKTGCPIIGINDGGGARIQEGVVALGLFAEIFYRNVMASGVVPQISLIMGPCAGGAVYSPAITDFTLMVEGTSHMFITGPDVIKTVTGEDVTFEDLGGATAHGVKSGVAHYQAADEQDCIDFAREILSYLPSNNLEEPPRIASDAVLEIGPLDTELDTLIPDSPNQPYDMHDVITRVLDDGFQYLALKGRLNLLLIDKTNPFGNGHMLPRGILREPVKHLRRANYIFLTKSNGIRDPELEATAWDLEPLVGGEGEAGVESRLEEALTRSQAFAERYAGELGARGADQIVECNHGARRARRGPATASS